jgi:hypothetical protein
MRYGPWPRRGRLLRHLCFSSSFPRLFNPGGARPCQGGTHCVQWGGRWRPALTWPRRDYIALSEEEEKRRSNRQRCFSAARGRAQLLLPRRQGGRSGEGARDPPLVPDSTQPGSKRPFDLQRSAATCEGWGGTLPPRCTPAHARAASGTRVRRLAPARAMHATAVYQYRCLPGTSYCPRWLPDRGGHPPGDRTMFYMAWWNTVLFNSL